MSSFWYHGFRHGKRYCLAAGPYATREEADAVHFAVVAAAEKIDGYTWMMDWFTCRLPTGELVGKLNHLLDVGQNTPAPFHS